MNETHTPPPLVDISYEREWQNFVDVNARAMFQTALLLSGAGDIAGKALIASLEDLDFSAPPQDDDLAVWQRAVVVRCVRSPDWLQVPDVQSLSMLQAGLRPVMVLVGYARIYFVLRMLVGYAITECAQILNTAEAEIPVHLVEAATQLRDLPDSFGPSNYSAVAAE